MTDTQTKESIDLSAPFRGTGGDYIVCGAGCAGLSLLVRLIESGKFTDKKILLVDKEIKNKNDRTWCFWEAGEGTFESIVYKRWKELWFHSYSLSKSLEISPYQYKLIRGIDFYNHCLGIIRRQPNIHFLQAPVEKVFSNDKEGTGIVAGGKVYKCQYVFNSIMFDRPQLKRHQYWLLQHFKGWVIETGKDVFEEGTGTLMDFRTGQSEGATFFYVLPFAPNRALVEYTLFSKELLKPEAYQKALQTFLKEKWGLDDYKVIEEEWGVIPMTNAPFAATEGSVINLGTAGGQTKASSGYTFQFIQKQTAAILDSLLTYDHPFATASHGRRFHFYDSILLHILHHGTLPGDVIFSHLFQKNKASQVFRFLDNETSLPEELRIISTLPTMPFLRAAVRRSLPF
ncbi:MAG: lycopene cyclase family protein [Chitinophagaceae bacterium]